MSAPTAFPEPINRREERHVPDDVIAAAAFYFPRDNLKQLAAHVGVHPRWLAERMKSPQLTLRLGELRADTFAEALQKLEAQASGHVDTLAAVMRNPAASDRDKLAAAKVFIHVAERLHDIVHVQPKLLATRQSYTYSAKGWVVTLRLRKRSRRAMRRRASTRHRRKCCHRRASRPPYWNGWRRC